MLSFAPDLDISTPEVLTDVTNMLPSLRGYIGAPAATDAGASALAAQCYGAAAVVGLDGTVRLFAGSAAHLYELSGTSWTTRTDTSAYPSGYSNGTERWRFAVFGNTVLAVSKATQLQAGTAGSGFTKQTAPKAECMAIYKGFVVFANCDDGSTGLSTSYGDQTHRWWCSASFDHTDWAPSVSTQCTTGLIVDTQGPITALRAINNGLVLAKKNSLYRGDYVGPNVVFQWSLVSPQVGCLSQDAMVSVGFAAFFIGDEDIYSYDGTVPVSISGGIREWFFGRLSKGTSAPPILGQHDVINGRALWFYPANESTTLNAVLVYDYKLRRWGAMDLAAEAVVEYATPGLTYDNLGGSYGTYHDLPSVPYNSPIWTGGNPVPAYFDGSHDIQLLTGASASSACISGYVGDPERWSMLRRVRPHYRTGSKPTAATCTPGYVDSRGDSVTLATVAADNNDRFDVRQTGRWHRLTFAFTGDHELLGWTIDLVPEGEE